MTTRPFDISRASAAPIPARHYAPETPPTSRDLLVLAHGAGAGHDHPFMRRYAAALAGHGVDVVTFDFDYIASGRRAPDRTAHLEATFRQAVRGAWSSCGAVFDRLYIGGKSMGGRMATHLGASSEPWPPDVPPLAGVVALGYPLVPPGGRRSGDRVSHLRRLSVPTLIVQGTRDAFGGPTDIEQAVGDAGRPAALTVHGVDGADHSFGVLRSSGLDQEAVHAGIHVAIARWIRQRPAQ